jgi:hypothetical protein
LRRAATNNNQFKKRRRRRGTKRRKLMEVKRKESMNIKWKKITMRVVTITNTKGIGASAKDVTVAMVRLKYTSKKDPKTWFLVPNMMMRHQ